MNNNKNKNQSFYGFPPFIQKNKKTKKIKYELGNNLIDVSEILSKKTSIKNIRDIENTEEELEII